RMDKSERMGSGIERIRRTLKSAGVKAPKFESDLFFTIVFERPEEYRTVKDGNEVAGKSSQKRYLEKVARKGSLKLSASSKRILDLIKNNPLITIAELAAQVGISIGAIKKHIVSLKRKSLIRRVGPDKGGHWECL
ncbi:winged helix-turn-helix transcriptional regulator, partial [Bdellovibrionota bacterium FG-2]